MPSEYAPSLPVHGMQKNSPIEIPGFEIAEKLSENAPFLLCRGQRREDLTPVLLKILNRPFPTPKDLAPVWQEFEILRLLDVPGVAKALSLENHRQWWMIVLADGGGMPVTQLEISGRLQPGDFLNIALQLARIVEGIHTRQVIHKNITPANILYHPSSGQVTLINFGLASLISREKVPLQSPYKLAEYLAYTSPESTGRMNRSVDYRTDYYSLGASLYELLTGTPPFISGSPLELAHAQMALLPDPPHDRINPWSSSPAAFEIISAVLLKLLAKNPEDRYQTPSALQADLQYCQSVLEEAGEDRARASLFIPGAFDHPLELNVPQEVIGRGEETETIVRAFERTISGARELVLIGGEAGVGKSVLANQLIRPVSEHSGLFLSGKFDQTSHLNIYVALIGILEDFCRLVLSEPQHSFEKWRDTIQVAVAPHGQLLTDLCPQLEMVIGPQSPVRPVDEALTRARFHGVVIRFLQALCQPDHPVVLFLDDLQWMTPDSSQLWQNIFSTSSLKHLLVVGAYRESDLDGEHPIRNWTEGLEQAGERITVIHLKNLEQPLIQTLVAGALSARPDEVSELTALIYPGTEGNPYFSIELLKSLYRDRLLTFSAVENKWSWDPDEIRERAFDRNASDFHIHQIAALNEHAQKVLQLAALIGVRFQTATLLAMVGRDRAGALADSLWLAMRASVIRPLDESYRLLASDRPGAFSAESSEFVPSLADVLEEQILFEFVDDKIQQAALAGLDEQQMMAASLQIGWLLLENARHLGQEARQINLLSIVDHLNKGSALILDRAEAIRAAGLNLTASELARTIAAFKAASHYLSAGIRLLPDDSWQDQYDLTLELHTASAEVALINGDISQAETFSIIAETNTHTLLEKVRIMSIRMECYVTQNQLDQVIELGIAALRLLGFELEVDKLPPAAVERSIKLPEMTDAKALTACRFAEPLISASFARSTGWLTQFVDFYLHLFAEFGNPPAASFVYIAHAVQLIGEIDELEQGSRIGRMALELAERQGPSRALYAVRYVYYAFIHHWLAPAREAVIQLEENVQPAFESGSPRFSISSLEAGLKDSLFVGYGLDRVRVRYEESRQRQQLIHHLGFSHSLTVWFQVVLHLTSGSPPPKEMGGSLFDEQQLLFKAGQNQVNKFNLYVAEAYTSLYLRDQRGALEASSSAQAIRVGANTHLILAQHVFIHTLALLSSGLGQADLPARLAAARENLDLMWIWAGLVPQNFLHQSYLAEAELARCLGQDERAARCYEQAIQNARQNGYVHESALAAELAAEFYLAREQYPAGIDHLCTAYYAYLAWGASTKVTALIESYPDWLPPGEANQKRNVFSPEAGPAEQIDASIDLSTILKVSTELAQETSLEELLRKMMAFLIENAGAQNGSLLLLQNDRWVLRVQGSTDQENGFVILSTPLEYLSPQVRKFDLPISVIHYVINLKTDLVLEDAAASRQFYRDAYVQSRRPKSILCAPLMNQGVLTGVIYLENNLIPGAFTTDRLEVVRLISSQAAVSIEKARLYETMELQVQERTRDLSDANRRLTEEMDQRIQTEADLRYNEALLRRVLEILPVGIWILDRDARVVKGNPEAFRIWAGAKSREWTEFDQAKAWRVETGEEVRAGDWAASHAIANGRATLNEELEIEAADGAHRTILNSAIPLTTEQDGLIGAIAVNQDITRRKHAEKELQTAHDQLTTLLEISQSIVSTLDLDRLLNLILDQLGNVMPYDAAAIMILEQNQLSFRTIRGPDVFQDLLEYRIPSQDLALIEALLNRSESIYLSDLQGRPDLIDQIQRNINLPASSFAHLRSWLALPLIAKGDLTGCLVLAHAQPDFYSPAARAISHAYANQVAIALHNAQLYKQAGDIATHEERNRLARELHDSVAQSLYSISLFIDATRMALKMNKPAVVEGHLQELSLLAREGLADMRLMIFEQRASILEKAGLIAALQSRLDAVETRAGFQISFHSAGTFQLSSKEESELYRIAQEALNNVVKHSRASHVDVQVVAEAGAVRITIEDNGAGFDPLIAEHGGGQGFRNMRERATAIGASCIFASSPGKGTKVSVEMKLA